MKRKFITTLLRIQKNIGCFWEKLKVKGSGVQVTLSDADYNPNEHHANQYIVHEHHVFKVINELNISGASAIAVNGQRLSHDSYILCNGPVIEIDGQQASRSFCYHGDWRC